MCLKARKLALSSVEGWRIGWIPSGAVEALTRGELEGRASAESIVVGGGEVPGEGVRGGDGRVDVVVGKRAAGDAVRVGVRLHLLLSLPRLHDVLPQLGRSVPSVDLEIESTGVADGDVLLDPPPEGGRRGRTVGARRSLRPRLARVASLACRTRQWTSSAVHLVVKSARVAQVVPRCVSPPEWG